MTNTTTLRPSVRPSVAGGPAPAAIEVPALAPLRRVVRCDAGLCIGSGAVLVAGAAPLADLAGIDPAWPVAAAGAFLLVLGVGLVLLARAARRPLVALVPWSAEGDFVWAAGSMAVAGFASLTGPGRALIAGQSVIVAAMGVASCERSTPPGSTTGWRPVAGQASLVTRTA